MKIIAHRGLRHEAPENTVASIQGALVVPGIDGIEFDVEVTADDMLVVCHQETVTPDDNFRYVDTQHRDLVRDWVREHSCDSIVKLDAGSWMGDAYKGVTIPTLQDVLKLDWREVRACVELKDATYWRETRDPSRPQLVARAAAPVLAQFSGQMDVISFNPEILRLLPAANEQFGKVLALWTEWASRKSEAIEAAKRCGATGLTLPDIMVLQDPSWISTAHKEGLFAHVYPVSPARNEPEFKKWTADSQRSKWRELSKLKIDGLVTDFGRETVAEFR